MGSPILDAYFDWLIRSVHSYRFLLRDLFRKEFYSIVPNDDSRHYRRIFSRSFREGRGNTLWQCGLEHSVSTGIDAGMGLLGTVGVVGKLWQFE